MLGFQGRGHHSLTVRLKDRDGRDWVKYYRAGSISDSPEQEQGAKTGVHTEVWGVGGVRGKYGRQELVALSCALLAEREDLIMFSIIFFNYTAMHQYILNTNSADTADRAETSLESTLFSEVRLS